MYQNSVCNSEDVVPSTANATNTPDTVYTKGEVGTKLSSDRSPCGYARAIYSRQIKSLFTCQDLSPGTPVEAGDRTKPCTV